ncbi:MAG: PilZ domain-containing protein, partial [bacterium]
MEKKKITRERRRNPRIDFELKVRVSKDEKFSRSRADDCVITDITKTGLGFISRHKFEIGEQVWMKFELMDGLTVTMFAEVYWRKWNNMYYCYGTKIIKLGWLSQRNLERGLFSKYYPTQKSKIRVVLEY